jgi:hypothetical protein
MRPLGVGDKRVVTVGAVLGLAAATVVLVSPAGVAAVSLCHATDVTSGAATSPDLQGVINAATAGDTVQVEGVCVGGFTIDKDLTLVGKATTEVPQASLDGSGASTVLQLMGENTTTITLTDLTVTHGFSSASAGGIYNAYGTLALTGSSSVTANEGTRGGGILSEHHGTVVLTGSSSVTENTANTASGWGAGIFNIRGTLRLQGSSSVSANTAMGVYGGGIYSAGGTVRLNDSSTVTDNTAYFGGGLYIRMAHASGTASVTLKGSSSVTGNTATYTGGGIYNSLGTVTLNDSSSVFGNVPDDCVGC